MPWPSVPYKSPLARALAARFAVATYPTVVAITLKSQYALTASLTGNSAVQSSGDSAQNLAGLTAAVTARATAFVTNPNAYGDIVTHGAAGYPWHCPETVAAASQSSLHGQSRSAAAAGASDFTGGFKALSGPPLPPTKLPLPLTVTDSSTAGVAAAVKARLKRKIALSDAVEWCDAAMGAEQIVAIHGYVES